MLLLFPAKYLYTLCIRMHWIAIYLFSEITLFSSIERTEGISIYGQQGHDKFNGMSQTSICIWSPCVFIWEFKAYWFCLVRANCISFSLSGALSYWCGASSFLHLWRLQGSKERFSQEKCKSSVLFVFLPNQKLKIITKCVAMFHYKQIVQKYGV